MLAKRNIHETKLEVILQPGELGYDMWYTFGRHVAREIQIGVNALVH